jgi:hypothetical protein
MLRASALKPALHHAVEASRPKGCTIYAKIFTSLFDGSMRGQPDLILVFVNLLCHADEDGVVDRHWRAIADETGLSPESVNDAIASLEGPDPESRTPTDHGKRIVRLDDHRDWGWMIVNYKHYRDMATREQSKVKTRERVRKYREKQKCNADVTPSNDFPSASTSTDASNTGDRDCKGKGAGPNFKQWTSEQFMAECEAANHDGLLTPAELTDFYEYWTEQSATGRSRYSMEKTWDTRRRMKTAVRVIFSKQRGNGSGSTGATKATTRYQLAEQLKALDSMWEQHKANGTYHSKQGQAVRDKLNDVKRELAFFGDNGNS